MTEAPIDRYRTSFNGEHHLESHHSLDDERSVTLEVRYIPGTYSVDAGAVEDRFDRYIESFPSSADNGRFFSGRPAVENTSSETQWFEEQLENIYSDLEESLGDPDKLCVRIKPSTQYSSTGGAAAVIEQMTAVYEDETALFDD